MPPLNFLLTSIYLFSKLWISFDKGIRPFHTKNHAMFANNFKIERAIASWKINEAIYKHIKAQYLNMNILCIMAGQTCCFLQDYIELRPLTSYSLKSSLQLHIVYNCSLQSYFYKLHLRQRICV